MMNSDCKVVVLGISQDGGYPQCGCNASCCSKIWESNTPLERKKLPSCLGIVDGDKSWFVDLTFEYPSQRYLISKLFPRAKIEGSILTHAHIGHYVGLTFLSKEVMSLSNHNLFIMPKMGKFLSSNQPWKDIVGKCEVSIMENNKPMKLSKNISIIPFLVPHRDEFSETIGIEIIGPKKRVIFIPDIDSWKEWKEKNIVNEIRRVDYAFLDGTFFKDGELVNRNMSHIPHPRVFECVDKIFRRLENEDKKKVYFTHLNHTNPLLNEKSEEWRFVEKNGFNVAKMLDVLDI